MDNSPKNEQEILETIIETHLKALEFYKQNPNEKDIQIKREAITLGVYISCYGMSEKHPKYLVYNVKFADLGLQF